MSVGGVLVVAVVACSVSAVVCALVPPVEGLVRPEDLRRLANSCQRAWAERRTAHAPCCAAKGVCLPAGGLVLPADEEHPRPVSNRGTIGTPATLSTYGAIRLSGCVPRSLPRYQDLPNASVAAPGCAVVALLTLRLHAVGAGALEINWHTSRRPRSSPLPRQQAAPKPVAEHMVGGDKVPRQAMQMVSFR